jgi:hypothetical protein
VSPALAIGTSRPCSSWNTTQRSASVASTVAWATASSTRAMTPEDASACPTVKSRSRSRAHRRVARRARDLGAELVAHEGLGEVVEGAARTASTGGLDGAVRGHDQHRQARLALVERFHQAHAVQRLHAQIEQGEIEARCLGPPRAPCGDRWWPSRRSPSR